MVRAFSKHKTQFTFFCLEKIKELRDQGIRPDAKFYATCLQGIAKFSLNTEASIIVKNMQIDQVEPNQDISRLLTKIWSRLKDKDDLYLQLEALLSSPGLSEVSRLNLMVHLSCMTNRVSDALDVVAEIRLKGYTPTAQTYYPLIKVVVDTQDEKVLLKVMEGMVLDNIPPQMNFFQACLLVHLKQGDFVAFSRMIRSLVENGFRVPNWLVMDLFRLSLQTGRDARFLLRVLDSLEPATESPISTAHVLLMDLLLADGRVEDVGAVWVNLKTNGLSLLGESDWTVLRRFASDDRLAHLDIRSQISLFLPDVSRHPLPDDPVPP